ncbi:alcohol dehydrogenase catalytic domain-containing protein [Paludisphaera soli]|uniref:alcohol dehydrogenase catalytic domain-containing protein n=1 Tax=Paludisphaera soli TaxID=2712865 RepID=UPI0013EDD93E|nr:alcohol dehydrogenase catalytic domain-containing protein [Paludisphaera soli]
MNATAAVFQGVGRPFDIAIRPLHRPAGGEVLVEVVACTLCGSDLHSIHGRRSVPTPSVLGHEIIGRILDFGPDAGRLDAAGLTLASGDRVTWAIVASCGGCISCRRGLPQKCERGFKYGHEPMSPGRELSGGLADHCLLVPGTAIFRVPDGLSDATACPASCATATVAAAIEAAGPLEGRKVLVIGTGMLGVTAAAWTRVLGASDVIACDPNEERLASAAEFGATRSASPSRLAEVVTQATEGRGVDVALDFSGSPDAIEAALPLI